MWLSEDDSLSPGNLVKICVDNRTLSRASIGQAQFVIAFSDLNDLVR